MLALLFGLCSCNSQGNMPHNLTEGEIHLSNGQVIKAKIVYRSEEKARGLSGVSPQDFADDQGLLFFFPNKGVRSFWMPDTYFDLDIFYLDQDLKVLHIIRNAPHHPGFKEPIPRLKEVVAWHVLEMKSGSPLAAQIKVGQTLNWNPSWNKVSRYLLGLFRK